MNSPNQATIAIAGGSWLLSLKAVARLAGMKGASMTLIDESGHFKITCPVQMMPYVEDGDLVHVTLGALKVSVNPTVPPQFILPGAGNA